MRDDAPSTKIAPDNGSIEEKKNAQRLSSVHNRFFSESASQASAFTEILTEILSEMALMTNIFSKMLMEWEHSNSASSISLRDLSDFVQTEIDYFSLFENRIETISITTHINPAVKNHLSNTREILSRFSELITDLQTTNSLEELLAIEERIYDFSLTLKDLPRDDPMSENFLRQYLLLNQLFFEYTHHEFQLARGNLVTAMQLRQ